MKVLIIGAVAGGANTATRLRRIDKDAEIIIFERGVFVSYAPCGLPYYIGGRVKDPDSLVLMTPQSFLERYDIRARTSSNVRSIDKKAKTITVEDQRNGGVYTESYDKLVIATGTEPVRPAVLGLESRRVFMLHTIPDGERLMEFMRGENPKSAAILGGGAIGLETAENLKQLGMDVTIIEMAGQLISPLDPDMAESVRAYAVEQGVNILLNTGAESVEEKGNRLTIKLSEGEIETDMLIVGVGVRPNGELAQNAGLAVNERGAIITDKRMRTSDPDIYAVGDVVQTYNYITSKPAGVPLAGPASRQARVAADNIAGGDSEYAGTQGSGILKLFDMTVAFTGLSEREAVRNGLSCGRVMISALPCAEYYPGAREMVIKAVFDRMNGRILGSQVVGFEGADKRNDVLAMAIRMGATYKDLAEADLAYSPPYGSPKDPVNVIGQIIGNIMEKQEKNPRGSRTAE